MQGERLMTRWLAPLCSVVLVAGPAAMDAHAQAHVAAAQAAVSPPGAANLTQPLHVFQDLFDQVCAEPRLPDAMGVQDRSAVVPREE